MKPECHHPPFVLHLTEPVTMDRLADITERLEHNPRTPIASDGAIIVDVVECSWCRNPDEGVTTVLAEACPCRVGVAKGDGHVCDVQTESGC